MSARFQQEFLSTVADEIHPLLQEDWDEIGDDHLPLDPDFEGYEELEARNLLRIFTARVDGTLAGYFVVIYVPSLQSKGQHLAINDTIFISKAYRGKMLGARLFKFAEQCVKEDGFERLYVVVTEKNDIGDNLCRMGYNKIETRYEKVL
jgi:GNAT superfamily N-acetyltransferase